MQQAASIYKQLRIARIAQETQDTKTFVFENNGVHIPYKAGQYLTFVFHINGQEARRSYSIASSPVLQEQLYITVKRVQNGAISRPLFDHAKPGDILLTTGAAGFFVLPDALSTDHQLFFMAAGSGIVPVYSLLKTVLHTQPGMRVVLIYSNRSERDTIYFKELKALQEQFPVNLQIEFLFSLSPDLARARLNQVLLQSLLKQYAAAPAEKMLFYVCGPFAYMRMIEIELQTMGFVADQVRKEQFNTIRPAVKILPPDTDAHTVELNIAGSTHRIQVQYPVTILEAAKKAGITLPYSCEVGRCGSCAATCIQGKVWMMYNEVLLNDEVRKGIVLTCSGFPVEGDVILKF
ncbi:MAG TPA: ferredoxin--NADP reductase [Chitinophagaceae bacterium]|nr:ferredoxin--NADP reductase [Chitinophagaceae bacterium]